MIIFLYIKRNIKSPACYTGYFRHSGFLLESTVRVCKNNCTSSRHMLNSYPGAGKTLVITRDYPVLSFTPRILTSNSGYCLPLST